MLEAYREKFGATRTVLIWGGVYFLSQAVIAFIIQPMDPILFLKAQTTFSKDTYLNIFNQWGVDGLLVNYRRHFLFDSVHPFWYALFLGSWIAKGLNLNNSSSKYNWIILIPFLAGLMDMIENGFHLGFLADIQTVTNTRIFLSALAANIKWASAGISVLVCLSLTAASLFRRKRR